MDANTMPLDDAIDLIIRDACETDPNWVTPPDTLIQIVESDLRAILQDRLAALSQPQRAEVPVLTDAIVRTALQDAWDDYCGDAQAFPDCFRIERGPKLYADFDRCSNFILSVRLALEAAIRAAAPPAPAQADTLAPIRSAIADYHYALDARHIAGVAGHRALETIEAALDMPWVPGAEKARRDAPQAQEGGK